MRTTGSTRPSNVVRSPSGDGEDETGCSMNVVEAEKNFAKLVNQVYSEGISVDLERDDKVIARLTPAQPGSPLTVGELNAFLRGLPALGDDADSFAKDVQAAREFLRLSRLRELKSVSGKVEFDVSS